MCDMCRSHPGVLAWVLPIIGAILGVVALPQVQASGERGKGLAKWAIAIGILATVSWCLNFFVWKVIRFW